MTFTYFPGDCGLHHVHTHHINIHATCKRHVEKRLAVGSAQKMLWRCRHSCIPLSGVCWYIPRTDSFFSAQLQTVRASHSCRVKPPRCHAIFIIISTSPMHCCLSRSRR